ncbi:hypothetical protein NOCA2570103 [metagenome]|uniref:Uncharacterized protein n=1 Tax=metagenome TaxID=256318 RepID=A0A2P2CB77_9ZZZZ
MTKASGDVERTLRRHDNDIVSIYELLATIQTKLVEHDRRFDRVDLRLDSLETKVDSLETKVDALGVTLATVLEFVRPTR